MEPVRNARRVATPAGNGNLGLPSRGGWASLSEDFDCEARQGGPNVIRFQC